MNSHPLLIACVYLIFAAVLFRFVKQVDCDRRIKHLEQVVDRQEVQIESANQRIIYLQDRVDPSPFSGRIGSQFSQ